MILAAISTVAHADDLPFTSISCGDHWWKIHAKVDATSGAASVWFTGDSQPDGAVVAAMVTTTGNEVAIALQDDSHTTLVIDASDHWHDLYWGALIVEGNSQQLGLCDAE
jgi:hypothetical protein